MLLSKQAGCTTAQACLPGSAKSLTNDTAGLTSDNVWETHALSIDFPDGGHDYELVLVGDRADGVTEFYQFDVAAASLQAS